MRLVSFKGDSKKLSPKARWRILLGYVYLPGDSSSTCLMCFEATNAPLIDMTGLWTAVGPVYAMLSTIILASLAQTPQVETLSRFTSMQDPPSIAGKAYGCGLPAFGRVFSVNEVRI